MRTRTYSIARRSKEGTNIFIPSLKCASMVQPRYSQAFIIIDKESSMNFCCDVKCVTFARQEIESVLAEG